ncbi:hypothetical protein Golob_006622, partial [Gossypium lobatum]|nr:hypothetical protein [Gossypium lobatum]
TLAELKEEISSHLKENRSLKNELEIVKLKFENIKTKNETLSRKLQFEKERTTNESSKRMKYRDLHGTFMTNSSSITLMRDSWLLCRTLDSHRATETSTACIEPKINATSEPPQQREVASQTSAACNENKQHPPNECSEGQDMTKASCDDASFALPDLNLPIEDDS